MTRDDAVFVVPFLQIYRYFAADCRKSFPGVATGPIRVPGKIVCDSRYSDVQPSSEGEVSTGIFMHLSWNIAMSWSIINNVYVYVEGPRAELDLVCVLTMTNIWILSHLLYFFEYIKMQANWWMFDLVINT